MDKLNLDHHISQQFNQDLEVARKKLMKMGGVVEQQVRDAIHSLVEADSKLAEHVVATDKEVNMMEVDLDDECTRILALRQPAASDLRFILAVTKSVNDLERIGDEASKVARQAIELTKQGEAPKGYVEIRHIGDRVVRMVQDSLDAFARLDSHAALNILKADKEVDLEYGTAVRAMITVMMEDPRTITRVMNVMWALRALERIGDHARNVAEYIIFLVEGEDTRHKGLEHVERLLDH